MASLLSKITSREPKGDGPIAEDYSYSESWQGADGSENSKQTRKLNRFGNWHLLSDGVHGANELMTVQMYRDI
jgi:hypothetical protein